MRSAEPAAPLPDPNSEGARPVNHSSAKPVHDRSALALFDPRQKLKLGLFSFNVSGGMMATTVPTTYELSWQHTRRIALQAEAMGFEALVPVGRWRGFGGKTNFAGESFETYTWAAGLAEATSRIMVFATSHVPTVHPILAAKQAATIDHISNGRFGLNLVMGWFTEEMEMFGGRQKEHEQRYRFGTEWVDIVKRLWTDDAPFDFEGSFFQVKGAQALPKPLQKPHPVLVNAGSSAAGIDFSARACDINFVGMGSFEMGQASAAAVRKRAREHYGRDISTMTYATVVCRDTEREAQRDYAAMVAGIDWEAIDNLTRIFGLEGQSYGDAESVRKLRTQFAMGWGGMTFVGSPEQVAGQLIRTSAIGIDGIMLGFSDYVVELEHFDRAVMPLLRQAGVRQ
jgi:alkanesulfonate monooxygenase SsuD/methylene tetrahydromethanopterin reductase-like flavin-dependent oxidoreductase (luciferase family)